MGKRKEVTLTKGGFRTVWRTSEHSRRGKRGLDVDVYKRDDPKPVIEWCYGYVPGFTSLFANATFWQDQAILQAKLELEKRT